MGKNSIHSFSDFISQPHVGLSLIVVGLVALVVSILEFSKAVSGY